MTMQKDLHVRGHHFIAGCKLPEKEFVRIAAVIFNQKWDVLRQRAGKAVQNEELSSKELEEAFVI